MITTKRTTAAVVTLLTALALTTITTAAPQRSTQREGVPAGDLTYTITGTLDPNTIPNMHEPKTATAVKVNLHDLRLRPGVYRWHFVTNASNGKTTSTHTLWWLGDLATYDTYWLHEWARHHGTPHYLENMITSGQLCATNNNQTGAANPTFTVERGTGYTMVPQHFGLFAAGTHYGAPGDGVCTGAVQVMVVNLGHDHTIAPLRYTLVLERIAAP